MPDPTEPAVPPPPPIPPKRDVRVRDAYGNDPYVAERYGPDGEKDDVELGQEPYDLPDPEVAARRDAKARSDKP